ncbi:uncharacterized protein A4U43_C07F10830, partial [Asparagus officinalis]
MSSSRRSSSRPKPLESNENELRNPGDPIPFPTPRSPLSSIHDPSQISANGLQIDPFSVKGAGLTPKSVQIAAARCGSRVLGSTKERGCLSRVLKGAQDGKCLDVAEVLSLELNEDPVFWKDHNVQVLIRIRPISNMESAMQGHKRCLIQENSQTLTWTGHPETRFTFDHVASETISQEKLFRAVGLPMVDNCMSGYNSCMFAYGQTGSGKTYTMMGEIQEIDNHLSDDRGMTPRIFEFLFTRIREEEERQREEQLKYSCKCSFLEIYNEQITDLLEPSSTNLQLREDIKKGICVENLKECEVSSMKDVMELLLQGAANRKMAATHMNSESSRSHSVFTCTIESRWERDSMTHFRFGRLNLVDLAGSERQKSSGAEGERLKEAANINRSLSTLGLVIMTLVDITNGKNRHVPYRDSRLTFLLQDSLGGNSKTTIIANVSPSICSTSETLSTLKFAQRAKLIQNNAKVNEDASGDIMSLQRQIQKLKDQLTILTSHQNVPRSLYCPSTSHEQMISGDLCDDSFSLLGGSPVAYSDPCFLNREIKQLEASLIGALRREGMAEAAVKKLEAEIKHMSRLVHQREDDAQRSRTLLKFREEKLQRLELLADDLVTSDGYLMEENFALTQEIQILRERIDRNPELTQFALENMRLLEQLRMYQKFYQQGERDTLLAEVSYLRNQLVKVLEGNSSLVNRAEAQADGDKMKELDECRKQLDACLANNAELTREVDDLRHQLKHYSDCGQSAVLLVEPMAVEGNSGDRNAFSEHGTVPQMDSSQRIGDATLQFVEVQQELRNAKSIIEEMESQQTRLLAELDHIKQENKRYLELSRSTNMQTHYTEQLENYGRLSAGSNGAAKVNLDGRQMIERGGSTQLSFHATLKRMLKELDQAKLLNKQLSDDHASQSAYHQEMEDAQEQVEAETAKTVLYLQEELDTLKKEFDSKNAYHLSLTEYSTFLTTRNEEINSRLSSLIQENIELSNLVSLRDAEISALSYEWEKAIIDLTTFLVDGCRSLDDASECIENVVESFPLKSTCINEHVERAIKVFIEKETLILDLQRGLEDAQKKGLEVKSKLNSLRGATLAITEVQQLENDENTKELAHLQKMLNEKSWTIQELKNTLKQKEDHIIKTRKVAMSAIAAIKKLNDMHSADSLNIGEIEWIIHELVNENPQVMDTQMIMNDAPERSEVGHFFMDDQIKQLKDQITALEMCRTPRSLEERMSASDVDCSQTSEILHLEFNHAMQVVDERTQHANDLFVKFEKVQETMLEAELVLQALLKANESAKQEKDLWKEVSAGLMTDKTALLEEVRRLETSNYSKEKQYENLQVQIHASVTETLDIISSLGGSFQKIQRITTEELNDICSGIFSFLQEFLKIIGNSRLCLEDIISEVMEKGFELFVLYQCHIGALFEQIMHSDNYSDLFQHKHHNSCLVTKSNNVLDGNIISDRSKDQQQLSESRTFGFSSLGEEREVLNASQLSQYPVDVPDFGARISNYLRNDLPSDQNCSDNILQLEGEIDQGDQESNNLSLKKELKRKDELIKGLLFDLRLLQESSSNIKSMKDELEEITVDYKKVCLELATKTAQIDKILAEKQVLEACLVGNESELFSSRSELKQMGEENTKLKLLLEDACFKKSQTEELLEEKMKVIEGLQSEILSFNSSIDGCFVSSADELMNKLETVSNQRDHLQKEIVYLTDRLEMVSALADENEAIAVEARQVAEASKIYAEDKEEEVKVLERSVEELEDTIDILEKKVYDMKEEVERHQSVRNSLELEVQVLAARMLTVENAEENLIVEYSNIEGESGQIPRRLDDRIIELCEARQRIEDLEMEKSYIAEEIKQYREHISELALHSEAQSSLYLEKFKALEAMVTEVRPDRAKSNPFVHISDKTERTSGRTRGSGSPFRCISSLVQQMNLEKDQELSVARHRIENLEALNANKQKEVCVLTAKLAAAESMTHDVLRDLLGLKLDMTNYANLIDQEEVQTLLRKAQQQSEESIAKEKEILNLKKHIELLMEERESWIEEINQRKADIFASQVMVERLQQREQLLTAQNEMSK